MQGSLIPDRDNALYEEILEEFKDLQLEMVACEMCGDYHPPEIHLAAITPFDAIEPEEA
jgi:hypothetical protein